MRPLTIGIAGSGFVATLHALTWSKIASPRFNLAGCCSGHPENAQAFAAKWSLPKAWRDYEQMLADPEVDVVDLCSPNDRHRDMIVAAAQAGKHIICEKPLTGAFGSRPIEGYIEDNAEGNNQGHAEGLGVGRNAELAGLLPKRELLEEALANVKACGEAIRKAGVGFGYAENFVYAPPLVKARRLLDKAEGTLFDIRAEESHSGSHAAYAGTWKRSGGGSLIRLGSHPIAAALHLKRWEGLRRTGRPIRPRSVMAETGNNTKIPSFVNETRKFIRTDWVDVEDWACAIVTFEDGSHATVSSSDCVLGGVRNMLSLYSSNAVAHININPNDALEVYAPREGIFGDEYLREKLETNAGWNYAAPDEEWIRGYDAELLDFVDCFQRGQSPLSDLELAQDTVKVIYSAYVSAEEGRRVDVP